MRDDDDRVVRDKLPHEILDLERRDRVQRAAWLIHQDDVGVDRKRPGYAQPLLLTAGERQSAVLKLVLHLVPKRGLAQALFDMLVHVDLETIDLHAPGNIVIDALRERICLLEDHPDPPSDFDRIHLAIIQIDAMVENLTFYARTLDEVIHPVDAAEHGALAASGWADQGRNTIARDRERDVGDGVEIAVKDIEVLDVDYYRRIRGGRVSRTIRHVGPGTDHRTS